VVLLHRRAVGRGLGACCGGPPVRERPARAARPPRRGGGERRESVALDQGSRPPRTLPQHAARLQGHVADERRQLARGRPRGDDGTGCDARRAWSLSETANDRRCRVGIARAGDVDLHGSACRRHFHPGLARRAPRAPVRLRERRCRDRGRGGRDRHAGPGSAPCPGTRARGGCRRGRRPQGDGEAAGRARRRAVPPGRERPLREARPGAILGGSLLLASGAFERWAIFKAGSASARDPKYTVVPQRARIEARASR